MVMKWHNPIRELQLHMIILEWEELLSNRMLWSAACFFCLLSLLLPWSPSLPFLGPVLEPIHLLNASKCLSYKQLAFPQNSLCLKNLIMISKFLLIEFLITIQIANIPFRYNFDKDDKQFHILWRTFDKWGILQYSTNCFVFGQETHSGKVRSWNIWVSAAVFDVTIQVLQCKLPLGMEIWLAGLESCFLTHTSVLIMN